MTELKSIRSGLKQYTFSNGEVKLKGWISVIDLEKIKNVQGRAYIEILPMFNKTESGFTHFVKEKLKVIDIATQFSQKITS